MKYKAGFLGCGNMGGTLARCACAAVGGDQIAVCDHHPEKTSSITKSYGAAVLTANELAATSEYIFIGIKPQKYEAAIRELADSLRTVSGTVLVSMAAGISIEQLTALLAKYGISLPIIRIMPNTPAAVREGMILCTAGSDVTEAQLDGFRALTATAGKLLPMDESKMDAAAAVSGCGPAFVYLFIEALADGGVECGLSRADAQILAAQTVLGAAKMVLEKGNPAALKDAVCSPGGTTIAGVHALERSAFRSAAMDAVVAAWQKTVSLTK